MYKIPPNSILTPYRCTLLGRIWLPYKTTGFWDFYNRRTTLVPDDANCRKTRTLTNLVSNGNFADGTTGWEAANSTQSAENGIYTNTGDGSGAFPYGRHATLTPPTINHKYYLSAYITPRNDNVQSMNIMIDTASSSGFIGKTVNTPTNGAIYFLSGVVTFSQSFPAQYLRFKATHAYANAETANGKAIDVQNVLLYDLTDTFGAGNEPTAAEMDALLADNGVTYHDGAIALQYQNRLTLSGATDAKWGLKLDGTDDYLYSMNSPQVDITTPPIHLQALIKVNAGATTGWIMSKNTSAANDCQYGLLYNTANSTIDAYFNGTAVATTSTASITTGKWYMVSVDYDGVIAQCYINGNANGSAASYTATLTSAPYFRIGRRETAAQYFNGWIDSAAVIPSADKGALREFERFIMRRKGILS